MLSNARRQLPFSALYVYQASSVNHVMVVPQDQRQKAKQEGITQKRQKRTPELKEGAKTFYKGLVADSEYQGEDYEVFSSWLAETQAV